jgi:hypothetical protein
MAIGAGAVVAAVGIGAGVSVAAGGDDDAPLRGDRYDRATVAALEETGGGTVLETEAGDDGAAYSVEIRTPDGRVVEVQLDQQFHVIGSENDDDGAGDEETGGSDD